MVRLGTRSCKVAKQCKEYIFFVNRCALSIFMAKAIITPLTALQIKRCSLN